jgi:predicted molibdopterin-dependent oxidoreductase YjgC
VRVHQDLVVNPAALLPGELVVLLPAQTRYEQSGGGTTTNTERRIRFTPEIRGHDAPPDSRAEWQIPAMVAARLRPEIASALEIADVAAIRREMARVMPTYAGIEELSEAGDWLQWGGDQLFSEGFPQRPDGRAGWSALALPETRIPAGHFYLTTRRGKQFNAMRYGTRDPLTGASRDDVLMNESDARALGLAAGARIRLSSDTGHYEGRVRLAAVKPRSLQAHWPEANVLIGRRYDPVSGEPDYNAYVRVEAL